MLEILQYATSGFWTFTGCVILLWIMVCMVSIAGGTLAGLLTVAIRGRSK